MISNTIKCNEFTMSRVQLTNAPGLDKVLECATTLLQPYTDFCMCSFELCFKTSFSRKPGGYKHTGSNYCLDQVMTAKYWTLIVIFINALRTLMKFSV